MGVICNSLPKVCNKQLTHIIDPIIYKYDHLLKTLALLFYRHSESLNVPLLKSLNTHTHIDSFNIIHT